jgi:hypothetical protein
MTKYEIRTKSVGAWKEEHLMVERNARKYSSNGANFPLEAEE